MKPVARSFVLFLVLLYSHFCTGQEITPVEREAYMRVLHLQGVSGETEGAFMAYLGSYDIFLQAMLEGTPLAIGEFETNAEEALLQLPDDNDPLNRFCRNEINLQMAFIKLKANQELAALWHMRQAYREAKDNISENPDYIPFQRTWGLLQILIGAIPDNYQWVPKIFGFSGDIDEGRRLLTNIPSAHWLNYEARAVLYLTDSYLFEEPERAVKGFSALLSNGEDSPLFGYLYMTLLLRGHRAQEAIDYYESHSNHIPLSSYAAGNAYLQSARYRDAINAFNKFEDTYKGDDFRKDTAYKLFLSYYLLEDTENAALHFNRIISSGGTATESDRYAARMHEREYPDRRIMKIRLATDGGLYDEAMKLAAELSEDDFNVNEDRVEFVYRMARLYHFTQDQEHAEEAYLRTIELQGRERLYFAPNSCLQLGYIYLDQKRRKEAQEYFRKTFDYRGYEYKKGIDRKAHSALVTNF